MKQPSRRRRVATGVAVSIGATAAMSSAAQAADLTVTTKADAGAGSLRGAIDTANATPETNDRILFQSGVSGTITLTEDLPALLGPTEISGPGMDQITVNGDGDYVIFASEKDTKVSGITLRNGAAFQGGGIFVDGADLTVEATRIAGGLAEQTGGGITLLDGDLEVKDSEITGNEATLAGGIATNNATVSISDTTISGNRAAGFSYSQGGGAVFGLVPGTQSTISGSVVSGNSAPIIGGMSAASGNLTVDSTLVSDNSAETVAGGLALGISTSGPGAGAGTFTLVNSTVVGNDAGWGLAGVAAVGDGVTVDSSTITDNAVTDASTPPPGYPIPPGYRAGVAQIGGAMTLRNSIVSGNTPEDVGAIPAQSGPTPYPAGRIGAAFNLIGVRTPGTNFVETVPGSNITSTAPQLGTLADNGGPTPTMLPADTSPVINQGSTSLGTDARGLSRPVDFYGVPFSTAAGANGADIGAVELRSPTPPTPPPPDPPSNAFSFGWIKLNKKKGVASLQVQVPGAGKVQVVGSKTVAKFSKAAKKAGIVTVTIKARGKAAKQLKKKGKAKVTAKVSFTPTGGTAKTKSKTVKLAKKKTKKKSKKRR